MAEESKDWADVLESGFTGSSTRSGMDVLPEPGARTGASRFIGLYCVGDNENVAFE